METINKYKKNKIEIEKLVQIKDFWICINLLNSLLSCLLTVSDKLLLITKIEIKSN